MTALEGPKHFMSTMTISYTVQRRTTSS